MTDSYWIQRLEDYYEWEDRLGWEKNSDPLDGNLGAAGSPANSGGKVPKIQCDEWMVRFMQGVKDTDATAYFMARSLVTGEIDAMKREAEKYLAQVVVAAKSAKRADKC